MGMSKRALIFGITGQDGSYLAEYLLQEGYEVTGFVRRTSAQSHERIAHILPDIHIIQGDILDQMAVNHAIRDSNPDEVYNLAAQSHVGLSFKLPIATYNYNLLGVIHILEAIKNADSGIRFYQASSSEMYGDSSEFELDEVSIMLPVSPYGISKLAAHHAVEYYRMAYKMYACSGIAFNHESPRRSIDFLTRKISYSVALIHYKRLHTISFGNIDTERDWGYAGDYVRCMHRMLQGDVPRDFVLATGEAHSGREFMEKAFAHVGLRYGDYIKEDPGFYRPREINCLLGNASKAKQYLGWSPKVTFDELVVMMVQSDLRYVAEKITGIKA